MKKTGQLLLVLLSGMLLVPVLSAEDPSKVTMGFVGDIMAHSSQLKRAWLGLDDAGNDLGYDFGPSFEWIAPYIKANDFSMGNLETTLGGPDSAWITDAQWAFREYQAYPTFTTPDEMAIAVADAGFDLIGTANNHCMDSNLEGASRTLQVLAAAGLPATGTSPRGSPEPWHGRIGGFDVSVIAWTHSVNGLISSRGMDTINVFNATGKDDRLQDMLADIRREAAGENDLVILFIHWGQEYMNEPDQYQKNLAALAIDAGVDVIIGSHPHQLQPIETRLVDDDGDGPMKPREVFIAWSLGNFISSQRYVEESREWVDGSALLNLEISRGSDGRARVSAATMIPVYIRWARDDIRVLAVRDGLGLNGAENYGLSEYDLGRMREYDDWIPAQMTRYLGSIPARRRGAGWRVHFPER